MAKRRMKRSKRIKTAVVVSVFGLVILAYCNKGFFKARESTSWPATEGKIISSELNRWKRKPGIGAYYKFKARYQYKVKGVLYNAKRVSFLSKYISKEKYSDIKNKYAEGKTIEVFYNPETPSEAVLITGVNKYNKSAHILFGTLVFCIGIFELIVSGLIYLKRGND